MPEQPDNKGILLTLAEKLPEELIQDIFPDTTPGIVREALRSLGEKQRSSPDRAKAIQPAESVPNQPGLPFSSVKQGTCALYTDGASRGNPGEAGAGIVLFNDKGAELAARSAYLGKCTNNSAEYQALIIGLETALEKECTAVHIFMDSELIVRQIEGRYKVKNEQLKPLFARVQSLLSKLRNWQIGHVPRAQNKRADQLANKGIDEKFQNQ